MSLTLPARIGLLCCLIHTVLIVLISDVIYGPNGPAFGRLFGWSTNGPILEFAALMWLTPLWAVWTPVLWRLKVRGPILVIIGVVALADVVFCGYWMWQAIGFMGML